MKINLMAQYRRYHFHYMSIMVLFTLFNGCFNQAFGIELTLTGALELALVNHPDLKSRRMELEKRSSEITKKRSNYIPTLFFTPVFSRRSDQMETPGLTTEHHDYKTCLLYTSDAADE